VAILLPSSPIEETDMIWEKPVCKDLRFGFEVTMYICHR
jgi:coenzyme PQQ precursor peptide PqqA